MTRPRWIPELQLNLTGEEVALYMSGQWLPGWKARVRRLNPQKKVAKKPPKESPREGVARLKKIREEIRALRRLRLRIETEELPVPTILD